MFIYAHKHNLELNSVKTYQKSPISYSIEKLNSINCKKKKENENAE